jgi:hypothetical protein
MASDEEVLEVLRKHASPGAVHRVFHYLYFEDRAAAAPAVAELRKRAFDVADKRAAMGTKWLVLACHESVPSEKLIERVRGLMESVAHAAGGEYDGWEVEIREN